MPSASGNREDGEGWRAASRGGFTITELLVVMAIISVLAGLGYPAAIHGSRQFQLIRCLANGRRLGQATIQCLQEGGGGGVRQSDAQWMNTLERYGVRKEMWICPTRRWSGETKPGKSDFMYGGADPKTLQTGEGLGELYLWIEKYPNHDGLHVCVMGDGRATTENLLGIEF